MGVEGDGRKALLWGGGMASETNSACRNDDTACSFVNYIDVTIIMLHATSKLVVLCAA